MINTRRFRIIGLSLLLVLPALAAHSETIPFTMEVGYRWLDVTGNQGVYRTQINERGGLLLRTFSMTTSDFKGDSALLDRLRIDSTDLGAGPASSLRLEAARSGAYRLRVGYRRLDAFSALPAFANPLLNQGIVPGQHTFDRTRTLVNADLEFLPDRAITPFVGYSWNRNNGPGQTTFHVGEDEFSLLQGLNETDREFRTGFTFNTTAFYGQVTQGWRRFRGSEQLTLSPGANIGNNTNPVLGQPVSADQVTQNTQTRVNTPFTNVFIAGQPAKRIRLIGNYSRFTADSNGIGNDSATGSFVSFLLSRDFTGLTETSSGRAKNTTWRGGARAEVALIDGVDFLAGFQREHRELDGSSLINTLYAQSITFGGVDRKDLQTVLTSTNSLNRDQDVLNAGISARALGPFAIRAEVRQSTQDFAVAPDLAEIVVPGSQGGDFTRRVRTFDTTGTFTRSGLTVGASWKKDSANQPVFRTDFLDRDRYRARAAWRTKNNVLGIALSGEQTNQQNHQSEIGFDGKLRQYTGDIEVAPITALRLRGSLSQFRGDTNILFRHPENFSIDDSVHREKGTAREGGFNLAVKRISLDAGITRFINRGDIPFDIDRFHARFTVDLKANTGLAAEWAKDKYDESLSYGNFDATRYGIYLRWTP
jgi:hypothetical protein